MFWRFPNGNSCLLWRIAATRGQHNTVYVEVIAPADYGEDDDEDEEDLKRSSDEVHHSSKGKKIFQYLRPISGLNHCGELKRVTDRNGRCTESLKRVQNRKKRPAARSSSSKRLQE